MTAAHNARIFRLFVSSTFSDFIAEREALQTQVFPELEKYCAERGARFLAVDLRWGITEEAQQEHNTMRICLEEVRRCQELSPRPNFAVLLGDRYGWEPVPARISIEHWKMLKAAAQKNDWQLIDDSYRLDKNAIPPVYCLKTRKKNMSVALANEARLLQALRAAAKGFRGTARLPYFASATHQEIALGALSKYGVGGCPLEPEQHVHVYIRHIEAIPQDKTAKDFIDWDASKGEVTLGARGRLRGLIGQLRRQLGDHVHDLHTTWNSQGSESTANNTHLTSFCDTFLSHQKALIDAALNSLGQTDERQQREQAHQDFGAERARVFAGRKALLARIARYATATPRSTATQSKKSGASTAPLVLLGEGGSGKSSLLARAVQEAMLQLKHPGTVVVQRYIGGVPGTESLMTMLTELTTDIASLYDQPEPPIPENAKSLVQSFQTALCHASSERPLALYLDALDQLNSADSAWMLEWLPKELPEHVRVVTTVRTGTTVEQSARRRYPRNLIEVPLMKPAEGRAMLKAWLKDRRTAWFNAGIAPTTGRRLTANQQLAVLRVFDKSGSALWLKLAYEEAATWASWDTPRKLPPTVQGLIEDFLEHRLLKKENHPKVFTEQALAYLTAGRFGLSESELGRTLGLDPAVRAEFQANEKTQRKWSNSTILPPILWSRLFFDLQAYLGLAKVDGALLMRWFHREFAEVLKARYLGTPEQRNAVHGALADTFQIMELEHRPEETNDDGLFKATDVTSTQVTVALRRVMEQPWQLARAGKFENLQILLTNFGFCMAKCAARRGADLIRDIADSNFYNVASSSQRRWSEFLLSVGHVLRSDSPEWPAHRILLQLLLEAPALENRETFEAWIACHARWPVARALLNLTSGCERFPMVTFDGHTSDVAGVHPLSENRLLSWSSGEHDIPIWNAFTGEVLSALRHEANVVDVEVMSDGRVLSSSQNQRLTVWSLESQEPMASFRVWTPQSQGVGGFRSIDAERFVHWSARREPWDYSIAVSSLQSGALLATLPSSPNSGHTDFILGVLPLGDDSMLSWSVDQTLRRWHIASGECQAATLDLEAPIVEVELSDDGAIHVRTTPSLWSRETVLWVLCAKSLVPLQGPQNQAALEAKGDRLTIKWGQYQSEIRWAGPRITLYPLMPNKADDLPVLHEQSTPKSDSAAQSPPQLTTLKILQNNKVLAGLSDASLALFDAQTGTVIDQLPGRADCAGSGCLLDENTLAIWPTDRVGKNLLRIWHPGARSKVDRQYVSYGRISGTESVPSGLLTWGGRSVTRWQLAPLRQDGLLQHPSEISFVRRLNSNGQFVSCDSEGNISFWQESNLGGAVWFHTDRRGVDDARLDGDDRLLVLYQKSGRDFIEGFSVLSGASLGISRRASPRPPFARRRITKQGPQGIEVSGNTVSWKTDRGDAALWVNRGGALDLFTVTPLGTLVARRGGELLLIHTGARVDNSDMTHADREPRVNCITEADLANLRLSPMQNPAKKTPKSWPEVFATLRQWAANKDLAGLDSPDFTGSTWVGGGVFVMSAHSPRAAQDVRSYRNISWAHEDGFGLITLFPKAIESLLKKMRVEVSPHSFMDKDRFYNKVAKSMATAEQEGEGLHGVLLAGVERAHELVQEHHNGRALNKD